MDQNLLKILIGVGFPQKHAAVYLALLALGEGTAQDIARASRVKRPTVYTELVELERKGLVKKTKIRKKTYFVAEPPREILRELSARKEKFERNLPLLEAIRHAESSKPRTTFLDGAEGFRHIWQTIFRGGIKEYLIITDPREMLGFVKKRYITNAVIKEKLSRGIKSRQLIAFSEYAKEVLVKDAKENRVSKVIPHIYKIPFTTIIFGNNVAYISPITEDLLMVIESEAFAKTQRALFEALWESLPDRRA